jgi:hypothetical protein
MLLVRCALGIPDPVRSLQNPTFCRTHPKSATRKILGWFSEKPLAPSKPKILINCLYMRGQIGETGLQVGKRRPVAGSTALGWKCARLGHRGRPFAGELWCRRTFRSRGLQAQSLRYGRQHLCATFYGRQNVCAAEFVGSNVREQDFRSEVWASDRAVAADDQTRFAFAKFARIFLVFYLTRARISDNRHPLPRDIDSQRATKLAVCKPQL